jgi:hypothetical protein
MLKMSTSINARMAAPHHGLLKGPRAAVNGLIDIKNALVKCLFIFNYAFSVSSQIKSLRTNFEQTWGLHLENCLWTYIPVKLPACFVVEKSLQKRVQAFWTHPAYVK